ncbi:hypothetical protein EDEG_02358 [Edhazardia aedis USNM 41457]|uniref:Post-GPI attachment to proteins factor 3 n=1 Tax=Edhazardia aedis (strain USNM 41457) TaxID=1003232 RepID=J9DPL0_EDHAE|nr:hypothetical protein EDEG_02358 [Edhazardia aedis USNM 41457]|eukprot:EJW03292.1 hypothetical protein EDEG_02358 [Edhazardia aedis USNM 41457]
MEKKFYSDYKQCLESDQVNLKFADKIILRSLKDKLKYHCHYKCSKLHNINHVKIDGRYPFKEIFYATEFFASAFSFLNLIVHVIFYNLYLKNNLKKSPIGHLFRIQQYIVCVGWLSSTLFHINDIITTRYMDYFTAFLWLLYGNYVSIYRLLLPFQDKYTILTKVLKSVVSIVCVFYYACHLYYMIFVEFNYKYAKIAGAILFSIWIVLNFLIYLLLKNKWFAKYILFYSVMVVCGALIEIVDYPPYKYLIDSHAFWHLITALSAPLYYVFVVNDLSVHESKTI